MKDCQYFPEVGKNNWIVTTELVIFGIAIALETKRRGAWKWKKPSPIFNPILWSISISPQRTVTANESSDYSGICCWSGACYVLLAFLFLRLASGWDVLCFGFCLDCLDCWIFALGLYDYYWQITQQNGFRFEIDSQHPSAIIPPTVHSVLSQFGKESQNIYKVASVLCLCTLLLLSVIRNRTSAAEIILTY